MGLLTDTKQREKFVRLVSKYNNKLCVLSYVVGLGWFLALAYQPLNAGTYFSENALLPGIVDSASYYSDVHDYYEQVKSQLEQDKRKVPKQWIYEKFRDLGLDVYSQNFSIRYPLHLLPDGQVLPGENIYAILRAPRSSSIEAVVMSSPLRPLVSPYSKTTAGIALMLALAKQFKRHSYWAKDIIFVVTEQEQVGMQAWLDGYHGFKQSEYILADDLKGRGGSIQAAINLEISGEKLSHLNIKIEGLNGQLPNLDLFNLVTKLCRKENVRPTLHKREDHNRPESSKGFQHSLKTMLIMMWSQATGMASGNHGLFHRYNIEALTLESFRRKSHGSTDLAAVARVVEGTFRSLNNLLERFHQSFFFYVLPATSRYVSIGLYMPPLALLVAPSLVKALALWIACSQRQSKQQEQKQAEEEKAKKKNEESEKSGVKESNSDGEKGTSINSPEEESKGSDSEAEDEQEFEQSTLLQLIPVILVATLVGILTHTSPDVFAGCAQSFRLRTDDALTFGAVALFCAALFFPSIATRKSESDAYFNWEILKCVSLIYQGLWLFSAALMNISLAFFLAVVLVPPTIIARPIKRRLGRWLQTLFLLIVSPPMLLFLACAVETFDTKNLDILPWLFKTGDMMRQAIFISVLDRHLIGNWIYVFFSYAVTPSWLLFWAVSRVEAKPDS